MFSLWYSMQRYGFACSPISDGGLISFSFNLSSSSSLAKPQEEPSDMLIASTPINTASSSAAKMSSVLPPSSKSGKTFNNTSCVSTAIPVITSSLPPMIPATCVP